MKKINREFCLTDNSVNCYGYRLLTEGLEIDKYRPPIGFLMHERERGVAVQWTDFRAEGDALFGVPIVNDTLFPDLTRQIEEGFLNAASVGHIVALEVSDDPADKLPGQTGPTVKRWYPREISIVDIPGNANALGRLYDENDNVLHDLTDNLTTKQPTQMDITKFFPDLAGKSETEIEAAMTELRDASQRAIEAQETATKYKAEIANLRSQMARDNISKMLEAAVREHKIGKPTADLLEQHYEGREAELKALLFSLGGKKAVPTPEPKQGSADLASLSWDELDRKGLLPRLKKENPDLFAKKFNEKFSAN